MSVTYAGAEMTNSIRQVN